MRNEQKQKVFFGFEVTWDLLQQITYKQVDWFISGLVVLEMVLWGLFGLGSRRRSDGKFWG